MSLESKPLLTVWCTGRNSEVARVIVIAEPRSSTEVEDAGAQIPFGTRTVIEFHTYRRMKSDSGEWNVRKTRFPFQETLDADPGSGLGKTKACCKKHSYWLDHAELVAEIRKGVGVLKLVPNRLIA